MKHKNKSKHRGEKHYAWKGDLAKDASKRNRAQRAFNIDKCEKCGNTATDRHHKDANTGNNARSNLMFLCRRCHMIEDGRLEKFKEIARENSALRVKPPENCIICNKLRKPLRHGRCGTCSEFLRRNKYERPIEGKKGGPAIKPDRECQNCKRITGILIKGRCKVCVNFLNIYGRDRTKWRFVTARLSEKTRFRSGRKPEK